MRKRWNFARKVPGKDSPRALAQATNFLVCARSLDGVTAEWLARQHNLSPKRAECMLMAALQRRANQHGGTDDAQHVA